MLAHTSAFSVLSGPLETGHYLTPFRTYPEMTAARLQHLGIPHASIHPIVAPRVQRDRTYAAALALRKYLDQHALTNQPIHLITIGPHARRSHLLFAGHSDPTPPLESPPYPILTIHQIDGMPIVKAFATFFPKPSPISMQK